MMMHPRRYFARRREEVQSLKSVAALQETELQRLRAEVERCVAEMNEAKLQLCAAIRDGESRDALSEAVSSAKSALDALTQRCMQLEQDRENALRSLERSKKHVDLLLRQKSHLFDQLKSLRQDYGYLRDKASEDVKSPSQSAASPRRARAVGAAKRNARAPQNACTPQGTQRLCDSWAGVSEGDGRVGMKGDDMPGTVPNSQPSTPNPKGE